MGIEAIITLVSLVLTKGPEFVMDLQKLFGGSAFTQADLEKLAKGVKDPASYFKGIV
jgi:hypothetical protein